MAGLDRTLEHLNNADESADAAKAQLAKQNKRLEKMAHTMNKVDENLDQSAKQIDELGSTTNLVGNIAKKALVGVADAGATIGAKTGLNKVGKGALKVAGQVGVDTDKYTQKFNNLKQSMSHDVDPGGAPIYEGWLNKKKKASESWEKKWCVLSPAAFHYFKDESTQGKQNGFKIISGTKCFGNADKNAPIEATRYRGSKPNGFIIDLGPNYSEADTSTFCFDAEKIEAMKDWRRAINKVCRRRRLVQAGGAATFDMMEDTVEMEDLDEEGDKLNAINDKLDGLTEKAADINEDSKRQAQLVENVQHKVEDANAKIHEQDAKLKEVIMNT